MTRREIRHLEQLIVKAKAAAAKARPNSEKRLCVSCEQRPRRSLKAKRCTNCQREFDSKNMQRNNKAWRTRVAKGEAGHRLLYRNRPTLWARLNPEAALKLARGMGGDHATVLERHLKKAKSA